MTFLSWASEPEHDERKKTGLKAVILFSALTALSIYVKRFKWTPIKTRKIRKISFLEFLVELFSPIFDSSLYSAYHQRTLE